MDPDHQSSPTTPPSLPVDPAMPSAPGQLIMPATPSSQPSGTVPSPATPAPPSPPPSAAFAEPTPSPTFDPVTSSPAASGLNLQPGKRRSSWPKRIGLSFLALIILAAIILGVHQYGPGILATYRKHTQASQFAAFTKDGTAITSTQLTRLNRTDLFFAIFAHAAQQTRVRTKIGLVFSNKPLTGAQTFTDTKDTSLDYTTKQYSYDSDQYIFDQPIPSKNRCIGTQEYYFLNLYPEDGWQKSDDSHDCTLASVGAFAANDGLNTGGLTAAQADTFVTALRAVSGLITVNSLKLVPHAGHNYLRFDVTIKAIKDGDDYYGLQHFMWSFKTTGLDPETQPYSYAGAITDGAHFAYYVDPATQLPVYMQYATTGAISPNGTIAADSTYDYRHIEYTFGAPIPTLNLADRNRITFSWPTDPL